MHQPGVVPLRPLTLGDMFGGSLRTIRHNPGATVGVAMVVTFGFMLIPIIATVALGASDVFPSMRITADNSNPTFSDGAFLLSSSVGGLFSGLAAIVVTGLVVRTMEQAVLGRRITAGEAWRRSRGRLLPLLGLVLVTLLGTVVVLGVPIGLAFLLGYVVSSTLGIVVGIIGGLLGLVTAFFLYVRYVLLAAPVLVLEGLGVFASLRRAGQLSRQDFWRLLGIYLMANLTTSVLGQVIAIPFAILGVVAIFVLPGGWGVAGMILSSHLSTILVRGLFGPFTGGVLALQYLDQRFRKEGLDIELLHQTSQPAPR